jgi:hypothetical protein
MLFREPIIQFLIFIFFLAYLDEPSDVDNYEKDEDYDV